VTLKSKLEKTLESVLNPKQSKENELLTMPNGPWNDEPDLIYPDGPGGPYPNPRKIKPDMSLDNSSAQSQTKCIKNHRQNIFFKILMRGLKPGISDPAD